jgi:hypothetical protein
VAAEPAPERPYSVPPMRGVRPGPLAFQCFDLADGDPELALLLAVTAVRFGYELLPKTSIPVSPGG